VNCRHGTRPTAAANGGVDAKVEQRLVDQVLVAGDASHVRAAHKPPHAGVGAWGQRIDGLRIHASRAVRRRRRFR